MTTAAAGWYADPSDDRIIRFWDGSQYTAEHNLSGVAAEGGIVSTVPTSLQAKALAWPQLSRTAWALFAGCAVAAVGTMLPWEQDTTPFGGQLTAGPSSVPGGLALLLGLLAAIVWIGWPARAGRLSKARCVGLTVVGALLAFFVFAKFASLASAQSQSSSLGSSSGTDLFGDTQTSLGLSYHAGSGLYIYAVGVISICAGVARAWFARRGNTSA
jgi:hypothetical protein